MNAGQIVPQFPRRLRGQFQEFDTELVASCPSNGDGWDFQQVRPVWQRYLQCQLVTRREDGMSLNQRTAHRQIADDSYGFEYCARLQT